MSQDGGQGSSDYQLIQSVLSGDRGSREKLGRRLLMIPRILRSINRRFGSCLAPEAIEELSQDVFVTTWKKIATFRGPGELDPWVYQICFYSFRNWQRSYARAVYRFKGQSEEVLEQVPAEVPTEHTDPKIIRLEEVMDSLKAETQNIIRLHHFEGLTFDQIADSIGATTGKVKSAYYRGLQRLKENMGGASDGPGGPEAEFCHE